ncbi:MAG: aminoacyl-tRNA hydrolase [Aeromicrobium sp.]|uniref:aminoacyl-tRNA hydrolase n=1 Tax=Aeromicrobium sp. TaxID=1871063 RepID=UPI0039E2F74B
MTVWLIAGLGNPGPAYAATRHNAGYLVTDALAARMGASWKPNRKSRTDIVEGRLAGERVVLGRARSYMNESGGPLKALAGFFDVDPEHIVVVHDELDIDFGRLKLKLGGGDNGHNGLKSLRGSLGTGDFHRVRFGIGRPPGAQTVHDFVLKPWSSVEKKELDLNVEDAADAVESLITRGLVETQSAFNR